MDVLLVLVGAVAALGGSIVVETYRSRRERGRWRLERRYETYVTALAYADRLLTWARDQASAPDDSGAPEGGDFHDFAAALALVGSDAVQAAWGKLNAAFRQFPLVHMAAINAYRSAISAGHADSDDAIRLRLRLADIVSSARECQVQLAKTMERDLKT
ncbi:MAG: hypothetical protein LC808_11650 [Actinobacteria bacterium]|nr:hypothetical protein [Actinomycetota bacterium]